MYCANVNLNCNGSAVPKDLADADSCQGKRLSPDTHSFILVGSVSSHHW